MRSLIGLIRRLDLSTLAGDSNEARAGGEAGEDGQEPTGGTTAAKGREGGAGGTAAAAEGGEGGEDDLGTGCLVEPSDATSAATNATDLLLFLAIIELCALHSLINSSTH